MKKQEILEEKWFCFRRLHCTEGFIDIWSGSETDNPNDEYSSEEESLINTTFYRLNGEGSWINRKDFNDISFWITEHSHLRDSNFVWEQALKK